MSEAAKLCGNCGRYWTLKGDSFSAYWSAEDRAGTCRYIAGQPFRLKEDTPIFGDCWVAPGAVDAELPAPGTYRHYKGQYYDLAWLARRESDGEWMCCYSTCGTLERWVRPAAEWFAVVDMAGTRRFTPK